MSARAPEAGSSEGRLQVVPTTHRRETLPWTRGFASGLAAGAAVTLAVAAVVGFVYGATLSSALAPPGPVAPTAAAARVRAAPFAVVLNSVEAAERVGQHAPSGPDAVFVVADVTVENHGPGPLAYGPGAFRLVDADGYEYGTSWVVAANPRRLADGTLGPGGRARGVLVFELPRDSAGLVLRYRPPPPSDPDDAVRIPLSGSP